MCVWRHCDNPSRNLKEKDEKTGSKNGIKGHTSLSKIISYPPPLVLEKALVGEVDILEKKRMNVSRIGFEAGQRKLSVSKVAFKSCGDF